MKFNQSLIAALIVGQVTLAGSVFAEDAVNDYVETSGGSVITNNYGECWRTPFKDTTEKLAECGYQAEKPPEVEVVAAATAATVTSTVQREISIAAAMLFPFDSAELSQDAKDVIDERIETLRGGAKLTSIMRVEGYTDSVGPTDYNQALSQRRAQAVADYILKETTTINPTDIEIVGKGEADPVAPNDTAEGRAQNRRVVVVAEAQAIE